MLFEAASTRLIKRLGTVLLLGVAFGVVAMNVFNPARSERLAMLERHHAHLRAANDRLAERNARLGAELRSLEEGAAGWQDVARREYGMIFEGEVVYRFPVDDDETPRD